MQVSYFLLFLCFRKVTQEIFSELDETKDEHIARKDIRVNFLFHFLNILKCLEYAFQNIRSICTLEER
jgi:hypothetical protein